MFYKIDFACDDADEVQGQLNYLYDYGDDINTKILHRNRMNLFCLLMKRLIERNIIESFDSAVDMGCNAGAYSKIISDLGFRYVLGIDIVDEFIERANSFFAFDENKKVLEYRTLNVEETDTEKKFDFVLCTEVIEHTDNPTRVIEKIKDILAPRGVAIITLPNRISLAYLSVLISSKVRKTQIDRLLRQHLNYPFYRSISLFKDKNLQIVQTSGANLVLTGKTLRLLYGTPMFATINRIDFHLSRLWPLRYLTQFFFIVLKKESHSVPCS